MIRITVDGVASLIRELAEANAGGVVRGSLFVREVVQEINIARFQVGAVYSAILTNDGERSLLEYSVSYGEDINGGSKGSDGFKAEFAKIMLACDDLDIKLREGRIEMM